MLAPDARLQIHKLNKDPVHSSLPRIPTPSKLHTKKDHDLANSTSDFFNSLLVLLSQKVAAKFIGSAVI